MTHFPREFWRDVRKLIQRFADDFGLALDGRTSDRVLRVARGI